MTRLMAILVLAVAALQAYCADDEKEYKRNIEAFDVPKEVRALEKKETKDPAEFWRTYKGYNMKLYGLNTDMEKKRGAEKEAMKIIEAHAFHPKYTWWVDDSLQNFCDSLLADLGMTAATPDASLHIAMMNDVNAWTSLKEDGFGMCISMGLIGAKGFNDMMLIGAIAHEYAHGLLKHHLEAEYAKAKRKRHNAIVAGITNALNETSAAVSSYCNSRRRPTNLEELIDKVTNKVEIETRKEERQAKINTWKEEDLYWYSLSYQRKQELEADLAAYRFMEYMGYDGENYIELLRLMEANESDLLKQLREEESDHPSAQHRIRFLKYVKSHPEIMNKANGIALKKLQMEREAGRN